MGAWMECVDLDDARAVVARLGLVGQRAARAVDFVARVGIGYISDVALHSERMREAGMQDGAPPPAR
jgi:hypothetical protein